MNKHNNNKHLDPVYKKDLANYFEEMSKRVLVKEGKNFDSKDWFGFPEIEVTEKECDCGTKAVHGKVPLESHSYWCKLRD